MFSPLRLVSFPLFSIEYIRRIYAFTHYCSYSRKILCRTYHESKHVIFISETWNILQNGLLYNTEEDRRGRVARTFFIRYKLLFILENSSFSLRTHSRAAFGSTPITGSLIWAYIRRTIEHTWAIFLRNCSLPNSKMTDVSIVLFTQSRIHARNARRRVSLGGRKCRYSLSNENVGNLQST